MPQRLFETLIYWVLLLATGAALLFNAPDTAVIPQYSGPLILYVLLTAFALVFGAALVQGELSAAHAIGVLAGLSLSVELQGAITWAVALGGLIGGVLVVFIGDRRLPWQRPQERSMRAMLLIVARVTLSFFLATQFYKTLGGALPIQLNSMEHVLWVVGFCVVYTAIYLILFLLEMYGRGYGMRHVLRTNLLEVLTVLGLPLPLSVLGAHIYNNLSVLAFAICMLGLSLAIIAPYVISRAQLLLRKQVEELRSLSVMSQAIRANYQYASLMNMVYVQVSNLLDVDNFMVALYDPDKQQLEYPLVIRDGKEVQQPAAPLPVNSPIKRVLETHLPLLLSRDAGKEGWVRGLSVPEGDYSWLGVPLQAGGSLFGAMVVTSPGKRRVFTSDDLRLLNIVAASTGVALENSFLYEQQKKRAHKLTQLNAMLAQLTESLSPDAVLETIVNEATTLANADAAAVMLVTNGDDALSLARGRGLSDTFKARLPRPLIFEQESSLTQSTLLVVSDVRDDVRAAAIRESVLAEGLLAWIELPFLVGGSRMGALTLYYRQSQKFINEDVEVLRAFATQASQAIQNAYTFRRADEALSRRVGQMLALATISHELTATLDLRTICGLVLEFALNATFTHVGTIMLKDDYGELEIISQYGYPLETVSRHDLVQQQVTVYALRSGEPVLISDIANRSDMTPAVHGLRSQMAVPIVRRGAVLGVITLESEEVNFFTEEDTQFVQQLADQAVIAIDNTQLFQRMKEARDRVQLILDNMSEPLLLIDRSGVIALANPRVDKLGFHPDLLLGQSVESLLAHEDFHLPSRLGFESPSDVRTLLQGLGKPIAGQEYQPFAYELDSKAQTVYLQRNIIPVANEQGNIIALMIVLYDETEAHGLAQAREDLVRMIVHDLRSPLTAVTTSLKLMNEVIPAESEFKEVIDSASTAGRRAIRKLLDRVDSLLDVARLESGQINLDTRSAELATIVDTVCAELSPLAHELDVKMEIDIPDTLPMLQVDADKTERVFLNLLDNALKFSPEDSAVTIRAHAPGTAGATDGYVRVDVIDLGPGVPEEYKLTLFNRFVQVRGREGRRRGSGLGLTFCRLVVEAHGGRIWIEDNSAGGTIFSFTLPVAAAAPPANGIVA